MTIRIQADTETEGVSHSWYPDGKFGTLNLHSGGHGNYLYFHDTADIDAVIAELVALRAEMDPPVIADDEYRITGKGIAALDFAPGAEPAPVTDSEDCGEAHPQDAGVHCGRPRSHLAGGSWHVAQDGTAWEQEPEPVISGEHDGHRDADGETWRTDGEPGFKPGFKGADAPERCEDEHVRGNESFLCSLNAEHSGLHSALTPTGAFVAEWGYADGHVHTTSGHQPAAVTA
jgi:hypothetical protein